MPEKNTDRPAGVALSGPTLWTNRGDFSVPPTGACDRCFVGVVSVNATLMPSGWARVRRRSRLLWDLAVSPA